jgi:hypothetical protein
VAVDIPQGFKMKLIISGGRNYRLTREDRLKLSSIQGVDEVVTGFCTGADEDGETWAKWNNIPVKVFAADWRKNGKAAGPIRNREMAEYADAVALFPGGKGTESMFVEAKRANIIIFDWRA